VWEWVQDWYAEDYYRHSNSRRPIKASIHQAFPLVFS
jgi:formylglycine-generating enzyme required for sulfatase activity